MLTTRAVADAVFDRMERAVVHGSTFGGNDLAAAAGLATLSAIHDEGLVERAARLGDLLLSLTEPLVERHDVVRDVRGLGLMWAIEFGPPAGRAARRVWDMVDAAPAAGLYAQVVVIPLFREHRILTQVAGHHMNVIKAIPPLVISEEDVRRFAAALDAVLSTTSTCPPPSPASA